jgi:anthranilate phosphoribosyltransferase
MLKNFKKLISGNGQYQDFLNFIEETNGHEEIFLYEIAKELLNLCNTISPQFNTIDICGTGGDSKNTTNISTISAFVLSSMNVCVAKHGGRSVSSSSGSVDFLSAMKIPEIDPIISLENFKLSFINATKYHISFANIASFRKTFGQKTIFNMVGPLINPVKITHQVVGIAFQNMSQIYANVLKNLGRKSFAVVKSISNCDELLSFEENHIIFYENDNFSNITLNPRNFKMPLTIDDSISGDIPQKNAENAIRFFEKPTENTLFHTICLNCAISAKIFGTVSTISDGIALSREAIFSKKPLEIIHNMQKFQK